MKICRVEEMRAMDFEAGDTYSIPEAILMENAGHAAYEVIRDTLGISGQRFLILCGSGNNGGDGFVVARKLHSMGGRVHILMIGDTQRLRGSARRNHETARALSIPVQIINERSQAEGALDDADAVIDALFGTGLIRDIGGVHREIIEAINESGLPVYSLDIPSGVNGDTGQIMGCAVWADYTISFGLPKAGNLLYPGYAHNGHLMVSHISFPPALYEKKTLNLRVNCPLPLPPRPEDGHKTQFGDVLFIAGASTYLGAPYFAARSFLRAGGGYARLASPRTALPHIAGHGSEMILIPMDETRDGFLALSNREKLLEIAGTVDLIVLGPGLGLHEETQELIRSVVLHFTNPMIIDGDGLTALSGNVELLAQREAPTLLTPHPGEMARLTGRNMAEILADPVAILQDFCRRSGTISLLKGAHTLIGSPDGCIAINLTGNSGMATAGSGDVLTGTIAAMIGLGLPPEDAAGAGVFIHGLAGDIASDERGEDGMTARDILEMLPDAVRGYREDYEELVLSLYGKIDVL